VDMYELLDKVYEKGVILSRVGGVIEGETGQPVFS